MKRFLILLLFSATAWAHQTSQAFLNIAQTGSHLEGRWDIALKDLHYLFDLDADKNGELTWGEVRRALPRMDAEILKSLRIGGPWSITEHRIETHSGAAYLAVFWKAEAPASLQIEYDFFFAEDPTHRALLNVTENGVSRAAVLTAENHRFTGSEMAARSNGFFTEGIWHIWTGFDHILFLLALLLPAVIGSTGIRAVLTQVAKIVTAFTLAHSITLSLAVCGILFVPGRIVEPIIGFSVLVAAVNNIKPMWRERGWMVAFGFGLMHGFGFAGALQELGLNPSTLASALVLFNLGVETGQLAIVALFVPFAFAVRESWFYRGLVLQGGSVAISITAAVWVVERLF